MSKNLTRNIEKEATYMIWQLMGEFWVEVYIWNIFMYR